MSDNRETFAQKVEAIADFAPLALLLMLFAAATLVIVVPLYFRHTERLAAIEAGVCPWEGE